MIFITKFVFLSLLEDKLYIAFCSNALIGLYMTKENEIIRVNLKQNILTPMQRNKLNKIIYFLGIILSSFFINSCNLPLEKAKDLYCPNVQQNCKSSKWNGLVKDTSINASALEGYYYSIKRVQGLDNSFNEYAINFLDDKNAFLINDSNNVQNSKLTKLIFSNRFYNQNQITNDKFDNNFHLGLYAVKNNKAYFASSYITNNSDVEEIGDSRKRVELSKMIGNSRLYTASYSNQDAKLSNIQEIKFANSDNPFTWSSQISVSSDSKIVFFASDMPGSIGGVDIWCMLLFSNGQYSDPINLGYNINSECDDITPFISPDSKYLLFSSMGRETVGGYDLFRSEIKADFFNQLENVINNKLIKSKKLSLDQIKENNSLLNQFFGAASNLRAPINTQFDEISPSTNTSIDSLLYYASNQKNGNDYDIYVQTKIVVDDYKSRIYKAPEEPVIVVKQNDEVEIPSIPTMEVEIPKVDSAKVEIPKKEEIKEILRDSVKLNGTIINQHTKDPVAGAEVTVKKTSDNSIIGKTNSNNKGYYELSIPTGEEIEASAQQENLFFDSYKLKVDKNNKEDFTKHTFMLPEILTLRINFLYNEYDKTYPYVIDSLGKESDKKWEDELDKLASNLLISINNKKLKEIILEGHTDYIGGNDYNQVLGKNRADFIAKQLVNRKIPLNIIKIKTQGKNQLLSQFQNEDDETYRKRLRRVLITKVFK